MASTSTFILSGLLRLAVPADQPAVEFATADLAADCGRVYHVAFWRRGPHLVQGVAPARIVGVFRQLERSLEIRTPLAIGPWAGWYTGARKANWPRALERLRALSPGKWTTSL